jgi:HAD superfamily hydrolase (TIGR01456 family)
MSNPQISHTLHSSLPPFIVWHCTVLFTSTHPLPFHGLSFFRYGYTNVMTVDEYHEQFPASFPDTLPASVHGQKIDYFHDEPIGAVMAIMDPLSWFRDLQICCDVLRSNGKTGNTEGDKKQIVPLYMSCPDFEYVTEFPIPRFGSGTFGILLQHLYEKLTSNRLQLTWFGKPEPVTYDYAESQLKELAQQQGHESVHRIYAIGDNPESDIQGANNAGGQWTSIMVRTGMFTGSENHAVHPADVVVGDVGDALEWILKEEKCVVEQILAK